MNETKIFKEIITKSGAKTQAEVVRATGESKSKINGWVKGSRTPKLSTLHKIANALGLKILIKIVKK